MSNQSGKVLLTDEPEPKTHQQSTEVEPVVDVPPAGKTGTKPVPKRPAAGVKPEQRKLTKAQAIQAIKRGQQSPDLKALKLAVVGGQPVAEAIRRELVEKGVLVAVDKRGKLGLAA